MTRLLSICALAALVAASLLPRAGAPAAAQAIRERASASPQIAMVVAAPDNPRLRYGVDAVQRVVRSVDGGYSWSPVFSPGDAVAPDPANPGACLPGTYDRVTFLAINPAHPGLYVGTEGVLGDYQDGGCGNAPGGLFYSVDGVHSFVPLNHGLPASADARGGGVAWGVQAIAFDPHEPTILYVQTDASFFALPGGGQQANPTDPGIYRTVDGGAQWDAAFVGIATSQCQYGPCRYPGDLAIDPVQPRHLLFATDTGFYRSVDRGASWSLQQTLLSSDRAHFLVRIDPYRPLLAYVVTDRAIYRTADGGVTLALLGRRDLPAPAEIADISFLHTVPPRLVLLLRDGRRLTAVDRGAPVLPAPLPSAGPTTASATPASSSATPVPSPATPVPPSGTPTAGPATPSPRPTATAATPVASPTPMVPTAGGAGWPMVGHDPGQSLADPAGGLSAAAVRAMRLRWRLADAAPAIEARGTLYAILQAGGKVEALQAATGRSLHRYLSTGVLSLAYAGRYLYFNRGSEIRIVDAATADWRHTAAGGTPSSFGGLIVAGSALFTGLGDAGAGTPDRYYAFDALTGRMLWSHKGQLSAMPCLAGGVLYLGFGAGGTGDSLALDPASGAVRRAFNGLGSAQWHSSGDRLYAGVLRGSGGALQAAVQAFDLQGRPLWVAHDLLFGAALPDRLLAVAPGLVEARSAADGHRLWRVAVPGLQPGPGASGVVAAGNLVYAQAADGRISILDAATGRLLQRLQPPGQAAYAGDLLVGDGLVFESVSTRSGGRLGPPLLLAFGP